MADEPEIVFFPTPAHLRRWLRRHHAKAEVLHVGFHKKGSGEPSITWAEAVDEALCFGWIDGVRRSIDATRYQVRFTPRRPTSKWSARNIGRMEALEAAGRMTAAGRRAFEARRGDADYSYEDRNAAKLDAASERELRSNAKAWADFGGRPPSYRKAAIHWITSAKRAETRARRLATLIACSAEGRPIPPLTRPTKKKS